MYNLSHLVSNNVLKSDNIVDIAKSIYFLSGISVNVLDKNHEKTYGYGTNHDLFMNYDDIKTEFESSFNQTVQQNTYFYLFPTSYSFAYIVSLLKDDHGFYGSILLGPIFLDSPSEHQINQLIKLKNFSFSQRNALKTIYSQIPIVSMPRIYYIEKTLVALLNNSHTFNIELNELKLETIEEEAEIEFELDFQLEPEPANHNYSLERLFMGKVANGDIDQVIDLFHEQIKTQYLTLLGPNKIRSTKNNAIVYCTLLARAAIAGGVDADHSLTLADKYINRIEKTLVFDELIDLVERMTVKFTNSVLHVASINHVSVIKKASRYVHNHLSEAIRLQEVADYVGLSPNYFSSLFKKEMSLAFADYVNHTRIKESQYLLQTTNHSILDIAISVGFNNQNYFTTIFKKTTGITPKQYRMRSSRGN